MKVVAEAGVDRAIFEIYGLRGVERFNEILATHQDWTTEQALKHLEAEPTRPWTQFFNDTRFVSIAQKLFWEREARQHNEHIEILEIGCSSGEETYSLAIMMFEAGCVDFHITAVDVNPIVIGTAREGKYKLNYPIDTLNHLPHELRRSDFINGYFEDTGTTWSAEGTEKPIAEAAEQLKRKTTFVCHDIIDQPVPGNYGVIVINNVLGLYPRTTREKMLRNILASMQSGGLLVLEPFRPAMNNPTDWERESLVPYNAWRLELSKNFPVEAVDLNDGCYRFIGNQK